MFINKCYRVELKSLIGWNIKDKCAHEINHSKALLQKQLNDLKKAGAQMIIKQTNMIVRSSPI